jgi:hypothetical protein
MFASNKDRGIPARTAIIAILALVGMVLLISAWNNRKHERQLMIALRGELRRTHELLTEAADSTRGQYAGALYLLEFLEGTKTASSARMVGTLSNLRQSFTAPRSLPALEQLLATDGHRVFADVRLKQRFAAFERSLELEAPSLGSVREEYIRALEQLLPPGMWRHVFENKLQNTFAVDYRATLRALDEANLEGVLRGLLRGLESEAARLDALATESAALLKAVYPE